MPRINTAGSAHFFRSHMFIDITKLIPAQHRTVTIVGLKPELLPIHCHFQTPAKAAALAAIYSGSRLINGNPPTGAAGHRAVGTNARKLTVTGRVMYCQHRHLLHADSSGQNCLVIFIILRKKGRRIQAVRTFGGTLITMKTILDFTHLLLHLRRQPAFRGCPAQHQ